MSNVELQALRRLLFFSTIEAASMIGGVSERAWKHWEAGTRTVPADVAEAIRGLADWREGMLERLLRQIDEMEERADGECQRITLVWYDRAVDWHGEPRQWRPHQSLCANAASFDSRVRLVPFDGVAYAAWLRGRDDTPDMRAAWADSRGRVEYVK